MHYRPLRPFFYKPVAILGVPLFYWKISLAATVFSALFLFFVWRTAFGFPIWFIGSIGLGFSLVSFFIWAHNTHKRGWIEYSIRFYLREVIFGNNLKPEKPGRKITTWLLDSNQRKPVWHK